MIRPDGFRLALDVGHRCIAPHLYLGHGIGPVGGVHAAGECLDDSGSAVVTGDDECARVNRKCDTTCINKVQHLHRPGEPTPSASFKTTPSRMNAVLRATSPPIERRDLRKLSFKIRGNIFHRV